MFFRLSGTINPTEYEKKSELFNCRKDLGHPFPNDIFPTYLLKHLDCGIDVHENKI